MFAFIDEIFQGKNRAQSRRLGLNIEVFYGGGKLLGNLRFLTPTRIKTNGRLTGDIDFRELVINLLRRICTLAYFHMPEREIEWNWRPLLDAANEIEIAEKNLRWHDWERYSNPQKTRMKMGGFLGEVTLRGDLGDWLPLLRLGEFVHVGKGATFGLGKYTLNTEAH